MPKKADNDVSLHEIQPLLAVWFFGLIGSLFVLGIEVVFYNLKLNGNMMRFKVGTFIRNRYV